MTSVTEPMAPLDTQIAEESIGDHFVGRKYVQLVLVLGSLSAIGPLTIDTYLPALPELTAQLGATDAQAQLTITSLLIGLGLGQVIVGPLSDSVGRRKPLLIGLGMHGLMSVLCALAPSIGLLTVTRSLQGIAGAAVAVVSMAIVRDLFSGIRATQLLSRLVLVMGVAPILAPSLGSALLNVTTWRGIFVVLAAIAVLLVVLALLCLPETLPPSRRIPASFSASAQAYGALFKDRLFLTMVGVGGLMFATIFAYVSGSPFILQHLYGLSPQQFGLAFGTIACGLILMSQLNPMLVGRFGPTKVLRAAAIIASAASAALVVVSVTSFGGLVGFMIPLWIAISAAGLAFPNAPAIALQRHGKAAGTAAALLGSAQFLIGGGIAPLVGVLDDGTARPMAVIMLVTTTAAALLMVLARRELRTVSFQ